MNRSAKGRRIEYIVRDYYLGLGSLVLRSAASKGVADLVVLYPSAAAPGSGDVLISCKSGSWPGEEESERFYAACRKYGRIGEVWRYDGQKRMQYHFRIRAYDPFEKKLELLERCIDVT